MTSTVGAIDCGTNSIRLLVARHDGPQLIDLERRMTVVRLGEGVDRTGLLSDAALERTFTACRDYRDVLAKHGVERIRFAATSASRDARNAGEFVTGVSEILGVEPVVISGAEEAALSFLGATRGVAHRQPALVFDIGGGSTEFVVGDDDVVQSSISVDMGCVRFHERYLTLDPIDPDELGRLRDAAERLTADALAAVDASQARDVIGVAGTVTTVAALALGLPTYDAAAIHGSRISAADVTRVAAELAGLSVAERLALPVMHPGRADVIVSGATILAAIMRSVGVDSLVVSEHDILDGLAWSLLETA